MVDLLTPVVPKGLSAPNGSGVEIWATHRHPQNRSGELPALQPTSYEPIQRLDDSAWPVSPHFEGVYGSSELKKLPSLTLPASVLKVRVAAPRSQRRSRGGNCR